MKILHYHADNGQFADNTFITDCNAQRQLVILQSQCPLPEWHHGTLHQGPTRTDQDLDAIHHEQVEENDPHMHVALRHEACKRRC